VNDANVGKKIRFCNDVGTVISSYATKNGLSCYLVKTDSGVEAYWPYSNFVEVISHAGERPPKGEGH
jgi:hypothetical protein